MGIQKLRVAGLMSLRDVTWEPGKLNVVIGPNGSGKSNLMRALELLHRSAYGQLAQVIVERGGIGPMLWDGRAEEILLSLEYSRNAVDLDGRAPALMLAYELGLAPLRFGGGYLVKDELLMQPHGELKLLERRPPAPDVMFDDQRHHLVAREGAVRLDQTLLSLAAPFNSEPSWAFRNDLATWSLYHDLRVNQQAPLRQAAVARVERNITPDGQNLIPVLHTLYTSDRAFEKSLDDAMYAAFGGDYEKLIFPPAADQRVQLRIRWRSLKTEQSAANLSDGTLRFLLLIAILVGAAPGDVIAIDEPETGLHPSMLPVVAELAAEASERAQIIFTTHSPQFLDAFPDEEPPTTTVAQWEDGATRLSVIDGDELRRWLAEFSLGSLFRSGELDILADMPKGTS